MNWNTSGRLNRVTAVFQDAALTFDTDRETTLAQLSEQLAALGEMHGGLPLSVDIRVAVESRG